MKLMLGEHLKEFRKHKNMTQQEVAEYMGLARTTISQYEGGVNEPDINTLERLAELYDVSLFYLLMVQLFSRKTADKPRPIHVSNIVQDLNQVFSKTGDAPWDESNELRAMFMTLTDYRTIQSWKEALGDGFFQKYYAMNDRDRQQFMRDVKLLWNLQLYRDMEDLK